MRVVEYNSSAALFFLEDTMNWLDLYNLLHERANDIKNLDSDLWSQHVMAHNAETGDEYLLDSFEIDGRLVLAFNTDAYD